MILQLQHHLFTSHRHTPYPLSSTMTTTSSAKPGHTRRASGSSTKITSTHSSLSKKISELDKESDMYEDEGDARTRRAAMRYNYSIRKKELELKCDEHNAQIANADVMFCCEHELKKLDHELKKAEKSSFGKQIEMLHLQIELKNMEQASGSVNVSQGI